MKGNMLMAFVIGLAVIFGVFGGIIYSQTVNPSVNLGTTVNNSSDVVDVNNLTVAPTKQVTQTTNKTVNKVISPIKAHHLAQEYVNNDYGADTSVTYGSPENGVYHMIIYDSGANYIGDVYVNAYTGNLIKIVWLYD